MSLDLAGWDRVGGAKATRWCGRFETKGAMRSVGVVVLHVDPEDVLELSAAYDQDPVETVAADRADPALREGVRVRRPERRADDLSALAPEDVIEGTRELAVAVMDQEPNRRWIFATVVAEGRSPRPPSSPTILW